MDLRTSFDPVDRLLEFNGLIEPALKGLHDAGVDQSEIDHYDRDFRAVVTDDAEYGVDAEDVPPELTSDLRERLTAIVAEFDDRSSTEPDEDTEETELGRETKAQLEDLGYM
ncbi:hypothetical protein VB773_22030 [Haloarculaceae archaeon H-GB2-1]|nr:hypothetical protein [Haloarculaceae archaeon H-GB11]MEA5409983.1 hypothetical protein [Haloarculaceae archaeon H-GB2-1]